MSKNKNIENTYQNTTRTLLVSDVQTLINLLNRAEYNAKACLKHLNQPFRNHRNFELPDTTYEQSKGYLMNNLSSLRNLLNSVEIIEPPTDNKSDMPL